jgi:hypothetical protein
VLSRLISLLSRIPAVKWAFDRLRPAPQGGSTEVARIAASESPAIIADIVEAAPVVDDHAVVEASHSDGGIEIATPAAGDDTVISAVAESPSDALADISTSADTVPETPAEVEPVVVEEIAVAPLELEREATDTPEITSSDQPAELLANIEPVVEETAVSTIEAMSEVAEAPEPITDDPLVELPAGAEPVAAEDEAPVLVVEAASEPVASAETVELPADIEPVAAETPVASTDIDDTPLVALDLVASDDLSSDVVASEALPDAVADAEAVSTDTAPVTLVELESLPVEISNVSIASDPPPGVAADVVPVAEEKPSSAVAVILDEIRAAVSESSAPVLAVLPPLAKRNRAPRTPTRAVDPSDRATLIRQRWEQTGSRMWNPRLHGTGEATLNIQGRIELLPPEPGDSMPRYDKLEFKLLGGQIVCEGVIVEAPATAGQRSFTRLAEPGKPAREPARERRAALA